MKTKWSQMENALNQNRVVKIREYYDWTPKEYTAFVMYLQGITLKGTADALGVTVITAGAYLDKARVKMAKKLNEKTNANLRRSIDRFLETNLI